MDKETLSNYGWIVICVLVLAVMIALATPFGTFVADAVKSTTQGLFDVNKNALNSTGLITVDDQEFEEMLNGGGSGGTETPVTPIAYQIIEGAGQTVTTADASFRSNADYNKFNSVKVDNNVVDQSNYTVSEGPTVVTFNGEYLATLSNGTHTLEVVSNDGSASCEFTVNVETQNNKIPEGGKYTAKDGSVYNPGDEFPDTVARGDKYTYGDYEYCYERFYDTMPGGFGWTNFYSNMQQSGWGVRVIDTTKETYGPILENIAGKPITEVAGTFSGCTNMTTAPAIPSGVTTIGNLAFKGCTSLTKVIIPSGVTTIGPGAYAFHGCTSLTSIGPVGSGASIEIPDSVTSISQYAFSNCTNLTSITLPDSVTTLANYALQNNPNLTNLTLSKNITSIGDSAISGCSSLVNLHIPLSVKTIGNNALSNCTSLTNITYEGTTSQWKAISINSIWKYSTPAKQVICSDGNVSI